MCQDTLQQLSLTNPDNLLGWVAGLCGIIGNEMADGLAGDGKNTPFNDSEPSIKVSF